MKLLGTLLVALLAFTLLASVCSAADSIATWATGQITGDNIIHHVFGCIAQPSTTLHAAIACIGG